MHFVRQSVNHTFTVGTTEIMSFTHQLAAVAVLFLCSTCTSSQKELQPTVEPPGLVDFIVQTLSWCCVNFTGLFIFVNKSQSWNYWQNQLLQDLKTPRLVITDAHLLKRQLMGFDCALVSSPAILKVCEIANFLFNYINFCSIFYDEFQPSYGAFSRIKVVIVIDELEYSENFTDKPIPKVEAILIIYNNSGYRSLFFRLPDNKLVINQTFHDTHQDLHDLQLLSLELWYFSTKEDQLMQGFWKMLAHRHNFTYIQPWSMERTMIVDTIRKEFTSLHRIMYEDCFLVPRDRPRPLEFLLIDPFDLPTWACILTTFLIVLLVLGTFGRESFNLPRTILELVQIMINSPHEQARSPVNHFIITVFTTGTFILSASYQSLLTAAISKPSYYPGLDNLAEINGTCNPMQIFSTFPPPYNFLHESSSPWQLNYSWTCFYGDCFFLDTLYSSMCDGSETDFFSCDNYRKSRLKIVPFPLLSILVEPRRLLRELVQFYATSFAQGGLHHFVDDIDRVPPISEDSSERKVLTVQDLDLVWTITMYGLILSGVVFVLEVVYFRVKRWCKSKFRPWSLI